MVLRCAVQMVLLGDDAGSLHLHSLTNDKLLATKQVSSSRINAIISCDSPSSSSSSSACSSIPGSSSSSRGGTFVQFAVLSEDGTGLWQLRQGFNHGIVPGGHRQGVLILQYCLRHQMTAPEAQQQPVQAPLGKSQSFGVAGSINQDPLANSTAAFGRSVSSSSYRGTSSGETHGVANSSSARGCSSSSAGDHNSSGGSSAGSQLQDIFPVGMLMSAGLDGKVIQWSVTDSCPSAVQSVLATAGAEAGSEMTAMAYLQGSSVTATGG